MQQNLVKMNGAEKRIVVLVDLSSYGIVELPIAYSLGFYEQDVRSCKVDCYIEFANINKHNWLSHSHFVFFFTENSNGNGYVVSFQGEANKNIYYHNMLDVVSDYLVFKVFLQKKTSIGDIAQNN
ncbi:hypothetical protein [Pedobacter borealis]|uniref:hypothetical protein n=1 Tax=Pedobacter borealis TaxID=475254 RepID=UPI0004937BB3|nr:hypothetical protein [Pedobacter borealis]